MVDVDVSAMLLQRKQQRQERMRQLGSAAVPVVRVIPSNERLRKVLRHPVNNIPFPATGSAEWPDDQFTKRRIRDGDVTIEQAQAPAAEPAARETRDAREQESKAPEPKPQAQAAKQS